MLNLKNRFEMKAGIIFILLLLAYSTMSVCLAQVADAAMQNDSAHGGGNLLEELYRQSNEKVIAPETADNMLKGARSMSLSALSDEQGNKLMRIYRSVS